MSSPVISGLASFNRWRLSPRDAPHPLLMGIHQPITEELTLTDLVVDATPQELPRIDERRTGHPYRYAYAMGLADDIGETLVGEAPLFKHDH